jgi:predicted CXXCH cytochrome family protein
VLLGSLVLSAASVIAQTTGATADDGLGPQTIMLDDLVDLYEPVPFSHAAHAEMAQMWGGCQTCHHRTPNVEAKSGLPATNGETKHTQDDSADIPACKSCHPVGKSQDDIRMPSLNAAYHRQCLDCHRDWDNEDSCVVCHKPRAGAALPEVLPTPDEVLGRMHPPAEPPQTVTYETRFTPAAGRLVTFRHDEHVKSFGFKCVECHRQNRCESCHSSQGQVNVRSPLKPAESWRLSHEPCMTCHDHQTCDHCHHKSSEDVPPKFEHAMTGQLLDADHQGLACRDCHGSVNFTALPTCGGVACHKSPELAAYPDKRPGELIDTATPRIRRHSLTAVFGVAPRVVRSDMTQATDTIVPEPQALPPIQPRPRMTTVERPTTASASCVTSECHVAIKSYQVVHGPVAIDACGVCHKIVDEEKHLFTVMRDRQELCTYCHEFDVNAMPVIHTPTKEGECLGCHNPHGGHDRSLTREVSVERMCNRCHESVTAMQSFRHSPVDAGYCVSCHSPHASLYPNLLDAVGPDLCLSCHDEFGEQLDGVRFVHKAMDEQCTRCHDVHGSAFPMSLVAPGASLCFECHEETRDRMAQAEYAHSAANEGDACMTCHTPHGGDLASLMRDLPVRLCMQCHNEPVQTPDGRVIAAATELMAGDLYKHGQINDGECGGCHEPHGGDHALLLAGRFEQGYFATDAERSYELCLMCHERELATQAQVSIGTDSPTKFRNGSLNLHYLHVANGLGRNCRVCHGIHAGDNKHLLLASVPYQQWQAPLELTETETGGRCVTGCHLPFSYDRDTPVALERQRETGEQVRRVRSTSTEPVSIQWVGNDTQSRAVTIPTGDVPMLLLFLGAEPEQDLRMINAVREALSSRKDTRVLLAVPVVSDVERLQEIAGVVDPSWQIMIEDEGLVMSAQPKARPITLVIAPDGRVIDRIGGAPQSLALKLEAYLDIARLEEAMVVSLESVKPNIIGGRGRVDAEQYYRVARQLNLEGSPQKRSRPCWRVSSCIRAMKNYMVNSLSYGTTAGGQTKP